MKEQAKIVKTPGTLSGRPRIAGHRIAVTDIWLSYHRALADLAVPMIVREFPELTEAQVRAALLYAWEHLDEVRDELREAAEAERRGDLIPARPAVVQ